VIRSAEARLADGHNLSSFRRRRWPIAGPGEEVRRPPPLQLSEARWNHKVSYDRESAIVRFGGIE
jgi:hypothetical protein